MSAWSWQEIAWAAAVVVLLCETVLAGIARYDARGGHIRWPWASGILYLIQRFLSLAMLLPDLLPVALKVRMPVRAAVERYKELTAVAHPDDIPVTRW